MRQRSELLNLLLSACCQRADVDSARLLVREYGADVNGDGVGRGGDRFPVICALPLYAAARAGRESAASGAGTHWPRPLASRPPLPAFSPAGSEELADFLLEKGAALSSYALLDHPDLSARLLARRLRRSIRDGQQVWAFLTPERNWVRKKVQRLRFRDRLDPSENPNLRLTSD